MISYLFLIVLSAYICFLILTGVHFNRNQRFRIDFRFAEKSVGALSIRFFAAAFWLTTGALPAGIGF